MAAQRSSEWTIGVRVWLDRNGATVLGQGRAELLDAIDRNRSISAAARDIGMSYRHAWLLVQAINDAAGRLLVEAAIGGAHGGGAQLTDVGRNILGTYRRVQGEIIAGSCRSFHQFTRAQRAEASKGVLHLSAAISLQEAMSQILIEFAQSHPSIDVRAIYGASDELADHLLAGAPGDVFISADPTEIKRLRRAGRLDREKARVVAANQLALVASDNHKRHHKNMSAAWNAMDKIAIAAPTCPLGRYSTRFLKLTGQYQRSLPKLLLVDNSRGVVSAIRSGAAEAGIAFMSDAKSAGNCITLGRVPYNKVAAKYLGVVLGESSEAREARTLLDFMSSVKARRLFTRCGLREGM